MAPSGDNWQPLESISVLRNRGELRELHNREAKDRSTQPFAVAARMTGRSPSESFFFRRPWCCWTVGAWPMRRHGSNATAQPLWTAMCLMCDASGCGWADSLALGGVQQGCWGVGLCLVVWSLVCPPASCSHALMLVQHERRQSPPPGTSAEQTTPFGQARSHQPAMPIICHVRKRTTFIATV